MNDKIVIGIPGRWQSRQDLVTSIAKNSNGYLLAGQVLINAASRNACEVDVHEHDPSLTRAFQIAGRSRLPVGLIDQIARHTFTLYLIGADLSSSGVANMHAFGAAILRSGGIAVKVESAGIAHSAEQWLQRHDNAALKLYPLFSTYVGSSNYYYSCGMKNFGCPDSSISNVSSDVAAQTMHSFNRYQLTKLPKLQDGHTFSLSPQSPRYRLTHLPYGYSADDPLDNPFGRWHMEPSAA
jgi:hypothetical protein